MDQVPKLTGRGGRRLAYGELGDFVEEQFEGPGSPREAWTCCWTSPRGTLPGAADRLSLLRARLKEWWRGADEEVVLAAKDEALRETAAEFRAILDGMTPAQRAVYVTLCKEPTRELYSRPYMRRHGIRGPGSVDGAVRTLVDLGELETGNDGPRPADPLFEAWVRERMSKPW